MLPTVERKVPDCVAYSDESHYNVGRWRSIGMVSVRHCEAIRISSEIKNLLIESSISEFKWTKLKNAKYRFSANKMIDYILPECTNKNVRVDIIVWDTHDRRHAISGRDDTANMGRMYFHLMKNVVNKRWPITFSWNFYPDEQSSMNWGTLSDCVQNATRTTKLLSSEQELFTSDVVAREFRISRLKPCQSNEESLIQLADMFAGMASYSRNCYDKYCCWKEQSSGQGLLFESDITQSNADKERSKTIQEFVIKCKKAKMSISIDRDDGLKTFNPNDPINFWPYIPQRPDDVDPIRSNS